MNKCSLKNLVANMQNSEEKQMKYLQILNRKDQDQYDPNVSFLKKWLPRGIFDLELMPEIKTISPLYATYSDDLLIRTGYKQIQNGEIDWVLFESINARIEIDDWKHLYYQLCEFNSGCVFFENDLTFRQLQILEFLKETLISYTDWDADIYVPFLGLDTLRNAYSRGMTSMYFPKQNLLLAGRNEKFTIMFVGLLRLNSYLISSLIEKMKE